MDLACDGDYNDMRDKLMLLWGAFVSSLDLQQILCQGAYALTCVHFSVGFFGSRTARQKFQIAKFSRTLVKRYKTASGIFLKYLLQIYNLKVKHLVQTYFRNQVFCYTT